MEAVWGTILVIFGVLLYLLLKPKDNLPPSPWAMPFTGHFHLMAVQKSSPPHLIFQQLANVYGPIMYLRLGSMPMVVVSSASIAKEVLKMQDAVFANRPKLAVVKHLLYGVGKNFSLGDPFSRDWQDLKKFMTTEFLRKLDSFSFLRDEEMSSMVLSLSRACSTTSSIQLRHYLKALSYNIITRMLLGKSLYDTADQSGLVLIQHIVSFGLTGSLADYFPWLEWLDPSVHRMKELHKRLDNFLQSVIEEHRDGHGSDTLLNMLLASTTCNEDVLKSFLFEFIAGGTDTSSTAIEWTLAHLLRNSEKLTRLQHEIYSVVGGQRTIQPSDISRMPFLEAVVKESMRLNPPIPLLVPHCSNRETMVQGYNIPAGTSVIINAHAIGRDPRAYEDPLEFHPERFLASGKNKDINVLGHNFELIPFGSGRRGCPGLPLGLSAVQLTIATLLHCFDISAESDIKLTEGHGITNTMLFPLEVKLTPKFQPRA